MVPARSKMPVNPSKSILEGLTDILLTKANNQIDRVWMLVCQVDIGIS